MEDQRQIVPQCKLNLKPQRFYLVFLGRMSVKIIKPAFTNRYYFWPTRECGNCRECSGAVFSVVRMHANACPTLVAGLDKIYSQLTVFCACANTNKARYACFRCPGGHGIGVRIFGLLPDVMQKILTFICRGFMYVAMRIYNLHMAIVSHILCLGTKKATAAVVRSRFYRLECGHWPGRR